MPENREAREECAYCGDYFHPQGLPQHEASCDENPENADATELVLAELWTSYDHVVEYAKEQGFELWPDGAESDVDDTDDIPRSDYYTKIREYIPKADLDELNDEAKGSARIAPTSVPRT